MAKEIEIELLSPMREGGGGTGNYNQLENKPQINGVELVGNKTTEELGIKIPTKVSELENDSNYATEEYVNSHGGKIDKITVNNIEQQIVNKTVNISVPTKTSDLTNDSDFATTTDLNGKQDSLNEDQLAAVNSGITKSILDNINNKVNNIPTKTSDLTNDSKFVNEQFVNDAVKKETDRAVEAENGISNSLNAHITNTNNPHQVTKTQVGLGNVDNTSDKNKPISDATQTALNNKLDKTTTSTSKDQVYTKKADGTQALTNVSSTQDINTIVKRDENGRIKAANGVANNDVATVGQMNTAVTNVDTKINNEITRATGVENDINSKVTTIEGLIPTTASAENQLADKNFVNSSISSVTATFRGNFATKAALDTWQTENPGVAKQNDYAIVQQDETHENQQWRYLFQDDAWVAQYKVNDAPFTQAQTDAINSGITKTIVDNTTAHIANKSNPHNVTKAQLGLENVDNTSDLNKPISTATQSALTHLQETMDEQISTINAAIDNKQDKITETNKLSYNLLKDTPTIPTKTSEIENDSGYVTSNDLTNLQTKDNLTTLLNDDSTNIQYPSAKAVVTYVKENSGVDPLLNSISINSINIDISNKNANINTDNVSVLYDEANKKLKLPDAWITYLTKQTFAVPVISLSGISSQSVEYGKTISGTFSHRETNIDNINGNLTLYKNNVSVKSGIVKSSTNVVIDYSVNDIITSQIIYKLECIDTLGTKRSSSVTFNAYKPSYYGSNTAESITSVDGFTKKASSTLGTVDITLTTKQYVYFVVSGSINKVTSGGFDVPVQKQSSQIDIDLNGQTVKYNVYRTQGAVQAGDNTFVIS